MKAKSKNGSITESETSDINNHTLALFPVPPPSCPHFRSLQPLLRTRRILSLSLSLFSSWSYHSISCDPLITWWSLSLYKWLCKIDLNAPRTSLIGLYIYIILTPSIYTCSWFPKNYKIYITFPCTNYYYYTNSQITLQKWNWWSC